MRSLFPLLMLVAGCAPAGDDAMGLLGTGLMEPFPTVHLLDETGHVSIPESILPPTPTPFPVDTVAFRDGFSPIQPSIVTLSSVNAEALPSWRAPATGDGEVHLVDLTTGTFLPVMAELDAHPDAAPATLIVRPQRAMPYGHQVAVVLTTEVTERPERFDALLRGRAPEDFRQHADHYRDLVDELDGLGIPADSIALAWDFPVGDGRMPLQSALSQVRSPESWEFRRVRDHDNDAELRPLDTFRGADGLYEAPNFLDADGRLMRNSDGTVRSEGLHTAELWVHIPASVADARADSVPIVVLGHGLFDSVGRILNEPGGTHPWMQVANSGGFIIVATNQGGLDFPDRATAATVAGDYGQMPAIPERMIQGQVNQRTLVSMIRDGDLLSDPVFQGESSQPLGDASKVYYLGSSMGSILGGVAMASGLKVDRGLLHIGGSSWSTTIERSALFTVFEVLIADTLDDPRDRQRAYALSQLWWDPVDPIAWTEELANTPFLLQENRGDESVQNIGTRMLARSLELPVVAPLLDLPSGLGTAQAPLEGGSALVQFDPMLGIPPDTNRPASLSGAHKSTQKWPEVQHQIRDWLMEGVVRHYCGDTPCTAETATVPAEE